MTGHGERPGGHSGCRRSVVARVTPWIVRVAIGTERSTTGVRRYVADRTMLARGRGVPAGPGPVRWRPRAFRGRTLKLPTPNFQRPKRARGSLAVGSVTDTAEP